MVIFKTIMMVFILLIIVNIVLTFFLWRSSKSTLLKVLFIHWIFLLSSFLIQTLIFEYGMLTRLLAILIPNFIIHYSLSWVFASMLNFKMPFKKLIYLQIIGLVITFILYLLNVSDQLLTVPLVIAQSLIYLTTGYKGFRYYYKEMTYCLKIIGIVILLYGIHIFTYSYVATDPDKLVIGFGVALIIHMATAILLPAAILEIVTFENMKLKTDMDYSAKLSHSSRMVALGEMASGVAHEINNPLTSLSLSLELAHRSINKNEFDRLPQLIERSQSTVQRVAQIVKGLLSFSRESKLDFEMTSTNEVIEETLLFCSEKIKIHNIDFIQELPAENINFIGERTLLTQVLLNIINNSYDAVVDLQERWIKLEVKDLGDKIKFSVIDSGKTPDKSIQDKMFEPFFTTKEIGKGTGLGLSISRGIIESHNGEIHADFNGASKVWFTIPRISP